MARIVRFHAFGGPEVLRLEDVAVPPPGPGEVLIDVTAFGLNRVEALYRTGALGPVTFPARLGYEAAGTVAAIGPGVTDWRVGDRVATLYGLSMADFGTHAERLCYPADRLVAVPPTLSLVDAAAAWMQYGTAYALVEIANVGAGDFVVVTAASSSVGIAAIQIARDHGAIPIAVTRGADKAQPLRDLGGAHVIVSDDEDVPSRVMEVTGGKGARVVFDALGGAPLAALVGTVARQGVVIAYGMLAGHSLEVPLPPLMLGNVTLRGYSADLLVEQPESRARMVGYVGDSLARGTLRPVIDSTFAIEDIAEAHRRLESNRQLGKIVVTTALALQE
ncbi:MAG TPA: zinc-dependent alcohol dehydrogenase family protein [Novosphingobium sp.]|nr:zinc-dependent alcohol dehydrogenase family protein [Novosphingobium sp.]